MRGNYGRLLSRFFIVCFVGLAFVRCDLMQGRSDDQPTLSDTMVVAVRQMPTVGLDYYPMHLRRDLTYDQHTMADTFMFGNVERYFQWDKIEAGLRIVDSLRLGKHIWGVLQNKNNVNGGADYVKNFKTNAHNNVTDEFGVERTQSIPLYIKGEDAPTRYALDGSPVILTTTQIGRKDTATVSMISFPGEWQVPGRYVKVIGGDTIKFDYAIFVDRKFQIITLVEKVGTEWVVRAMNPCTTGRNFPPYYKPTPLGIFALQNKLTKMLYYIDGTTDFEGFAPWANRFCCGAYIHGVAVKDPTFRTPEDQYYEFSWSLGTTPKSHMCVRVATSLAKYIFDNVPVETSLVFVIE